MPYVPTGFEENRAYLLGQLPTEPRPEQELLLSPGSVPAATSQPTTTTSRQGIGREDGAVQPVGNVGVSTQGGVTERLFQPLATGLPRAQEDIQRAAGQFYEQAGQRRQYRPEEAEPTLARSLQPYSTLAERESALAPARSLLGSRYTGPSDLTQESVAGVQGGLEQLRTRAQALGTGGGLQTLLRESVPGLSPGEARQEAQRYVSDSDFTRQQRGYLGGINELYARLAGEQTGAQSYAQERARQEADISARAREYLLGRRGEVERDIQGRLAQERGGLSAAEAAYRRFLETGDARELSSAPQGALGFDIGVLDTPHRQGIRQAATTFQDIMGRYPDLANVPILPLTIGRHGRENQQVLPADWLRENRGRYTPQQLEGIRQRAIARQGELRQWFNPGTTGGYSERAPLAQYLPLYFGGQETPGPDLPDPRNYVNFDPGTYPSRENVSSEDQRRIFNTVNELIDELDRIDEAGQPFQAARLAADIESYLEGERAAMESQSRELTQGQKEWAQRIRSARKKYLKAARAARWAKVGRVMQGVATLGFSGIAEAVMPGAATEVDKAMVGLALPGIAQV